MGGIKNKIAKKMHFIYQYTISSFCNVVEGIYIMRISHAYRRGSTCVRVNDGKNGEGGSKNTWSDDKCPDTHHSATTSRRVPQNRATMRPLVTIMLKCNLLITAAAPSRSLISPICTAVGERKQNGNERPVPPGRMIRDKEGSIGDAEGMATRDRDRERSRRKREREGRERTDNSGRDSGDTKRNKFRNR